MHSFPWALTGEFPLHAGAHRRRADKFSVPALRFYPSRESECALCVFGAQRKVDLLQRLADWQSTKPGNEVGKKADAGREWQLAGQGEARRMYGDVWRVAGMFELRTLQRRHSHVAQSALQQPGCEGASPIHVRWQPKEGCSSKKFGRSAMPRLCR